eukprot:SAG25_NODE_97_length_15788_cov_5.361910_4_plen_479_part_00
MSSWLQGRQQLTVTTGCGCWLAPAMRHAMPASHCRQQQQCQCAGALCRCSQRATLLRCGGHLAMWAPVPATDAGGARHPAAWQRYVTLLLLTLSMLASFLDRNLLSTMFEPLRMELRVTDAQLGLLSGVAFSAFNALFGVLMGFWCDRCNRVRLMAAAVAAWSLFTAAQGLASSFGVLVLCRMMVGVGEAASGPAAHSIICDLFVPGRRGLAFSIWNTSIPAGTLLGLLLGGQLTTSIGWRGAFIIVGLPGLLLALLLLVLAHEPARGTTDCYVDGWVSGSAEEVEGMWTASDTGGSSDEEEEEDSELVFLTTAESQGVGPKAQAKLVGLVGAREGIPRTPAGMGAALPPRPAGLAAQRVSRGSHGGGGGGVGADVHRVAASRAPPAAPWLTAMGLVMRHLASHQWIWHLILGKGLLLLVAIGSFAWTPTYYVRAGLLTTEQAGWRLGLIVVSRAFPSWNRSILTEIYLCHACSCHRK